MAVSPFSNYLATWVLVALMNPVIYLLAVIEGRELFQWFGEEYQQYMQRAPRSLPTLVGKW